jgi:UDP:flavonoid glycosyltransferase YjiC (YdhE family)
MAELLPYAEMAKRSAIVVSHGGTGGVYPALAGGATMLAIPSNYDSHLSTDRLVELGLGLCVRAEEATPVKIRLALNELLEKPEFKQAAQQWPGRIAAVDTKTLFPALLRQWFAARSSH